eukprot:284819499_4
MFRRPDRAQHCREFWLTKKKHVTSWRRSGSQSCNCSSRYSLSLVEGASISRDQGQDIKGEVRKKGLLNASHGRVRCFLESTLSITPKDCQTKCLHSSDSQNILIGQIKLCLFKYVFLRGLSHSKLLIFIYSANFHSPGPGGYQESTGFDLNGRISRVDRKEIVANLYQLVGDLNASFGNVVTQPVHFLMSSLSVEHLVCLYGLADIAIITPLRYVCQQAGLLTLLPCVEKVVGRHMSLFCVNHTPIKEF